MAAEGRDESDETGSEAGLRERVMSIFREEGEEGGENEFVSAMDSYSEEEYGPLIDFEMEEGLEEVDAYWLNRPFSKVTVTEDPATGVLQYRVAEPVMDGFEERVVQRVKDRIRDIITKVELGEENREQAKRRILTEKSEELLDQMSVEDDPGLRAKVEYYVMRDFLGYNILDPIMQDNRIEDISCDGPEIPIYVFHKQFEDLPTNVVFEDESFLNSFIIKLAQRSGKHISRANPLIDAALPDGSRIQMTLGREVTTHGSTYTIRKFSDIPLNPVDLVAFNTYSAEVMAFLWLAVENNKSVIYVGGTASGKTTSMNASSLFITPRSKVVTIEDTREVNLPFENWIPGVTRESFGKEGEGEVGMYDLLRSALRQRPEYLLVGEVRGEEAVVLFQAMSTGHTTFSTMHADSVETAIHRLENPPINVPRSMIASLDLMSVQAQVFVDGERVRRALEVVEIGDLDPRTNTIHTNPIYSWEPSDDTFELVGESDVMQEIRRMRNWSQSDLEEELSRRTQIIERMVEKGIRDYGDVVESIKTYYRNPDQLLENLDME